LGINYSYRKRRERARKRTFFAIVIIILVLILLIILRQSQIRLFREVELPEELIHQLPKIKKVEISHANVTTDADGDEINDQEDILQGAKLEVEKKAKNIIAEGSINYFEGGDPPSDKAISTDIIARALANAGYDLRILVDNDIRDNFVEYPWELWEVKVADPNIDYRRPENLIVFFQRNAQSLILDIDPENPQNLRQWIPGDIVFWDVNRNGSVDHCGIISDRPNNENVPYVIHNYLRPGHTIEEDILQKWLIVGHFRFPSKTIKE